jgi:hypothetical protein
MNVQPTEKKLLEEAYGAIQEANTPPWVKEKEEEDSEHDKNAAGDDPHGDDDGDDDVAEEGMFDRAKAHVAGATSGWGKSLKGAGHSALGGLGKAVGAKKFAGKQRRKAGAAHDAAAGMRSDARSDSLTSGTIPKIINMATELQNDMMSVQQSIDPSDPANQKLEQFKTDLTAAIANLQS